MTLVGHLYHDLSLRDELYMAFIAVQPYMEEYSATLQSQKSQDCNFKF